MSCSVPICSTEPELKPSIPTQEEDQPGVGPGVTVGTLHVPETAVTAELAGLAKAAYPDQLVLETRPEGKARVSSSSRRGRTRLIFRVRRDSRAENMTAPYISRHKDSPGIVIVPFWQC